MLMKQENELVNNFLGNIFNVYKIGLYYTKLPDMTLAAEHLEGKNKTPLKFMPFSTAVNLYKVNLTVIGKTKT